MKTTVLPLEETGKYALISKDPAEITLKTTSAGSRSQMGISARVFWFRRY
jgi:hypothetical protein